MSSTLRVLLIGRRFWPHGSIDAAGHLVQLASGLQQRHVHVEVLTPRYSNSWSQRLCFREIPIHRPVTAPKRDWSIGRYTKHMTNWLREHADSFDVLLADSAREEAIATVEAARSLGCQAVVRVAGHGSESDWQWWDSSRAAKRCAGFAKTADRIVVSGASNQRELLSQGFLPSRVQRIDAGFDGAVSRSPANRVKARRALATINGDFHAPEDEPVAVCVAPLRRNGGISVLVESARHLVARYPKMHFWFIGDGHDRDQIFQTLRGDGIRASFAMPGSFADIRDVFAAADLFVQPDDSGLDFFLPSAIVWELPIVVTDRETTRGLIEQSLPRDVSSHDARAQAALVHWFDSSRPKSFRDAFRSAVDDLPASFEKSSQLRRELVRGRSQRIVIDDYVSLLEKMRTRRSVAAQGRSIGALS